MKYSPLLFLSLLIFTLLIMVSLSIISSASGIDDSTSTIILVGVIGFIVTAGIFAISVVVSYKKKLRGTIYPFDKFTNLELTDYYDKYSHSHTTSYRYRNSDKNRHADEYYHREYPVDGQ